ncbi:MAG: peptidase E [Myxococcales bacterium]|nr:peptidase E [Myxococcales bacterium]
MARQPRQLRQHVPMTPDARTELSTIVAIGGGGFSQGNLGLEMERFCLELTGVESPTVCFVPTASAESQDYTLRFYQAFGSLGVRTGHLSLFRPPSADLRDFLGGYDLIFVGGGNTKSMLAVWEAWGLPSLLAELSKEGRILAGISAGAICWFEQGSTDSIPGRLSALPCLGFLEGSCCPHFDGEAERRPRLAEMLERGEIGAGWAIDDDAAVVFKNGTFAEAVSARQGATAYEACLSQTGPSFSGSSARSLV